MSPHVPTDWDAGDPTHPPAPYRGGFSGFGAFLRDPRAGVEDVPEMAGAGCEWLTANVGDFSGASWETVRRRAELLRLRFTPWARCYTLDDVAELCAVAAAWGTRSVVVNLERDELGRMPEPKAVAAVLRRQGIREAATVTIGWLYGTAGEPSPVDWSPLYSFGPVMLELFPPESLAAGYRVACMARALELGWRHVIPCYGVRGATPETYGVGTERLNGESYCIYTGDDVRGEWAAWGPA